MQTVLIAIHLMVVVALVIVVLLQRSEGGALGIGSSASGGLFTGRGQANALTRATAILAGVFFATSIALTLLASFNHGPKSIFEGPATPAGQTTPGQAPTTGGGSVLDDLNRGAEQASPNAPAPPASPEAPRSR